MYMSKESYVYVKRAACICQKSPMYISKEPYLYVTTDHVSSEVSLCWECQKSPAYMSKEPYGNVERALCKSHYIPRLEWSRRLVQRGSVKSRRNGVRQRVLLLTARTTLSSFCLSMQCICMYVLTYMHICMCVYISTYAHTYTHTHIHIHTHTHTHTHTHKRARAHADTETCTHTFTHFVKVDSIYMLVCVFTFRYT